MKLQTAINKCLHGMLVSNINMKKEYLKYDKSEKRILWWDAKRKYPSHWSYPEDKDSKSFIKELNLEWYECDENGVRKSETKRTMEEK